MKEEKSIEENSNEASDESEGSDSTNGINEQQITIFKSLSRLIQNLTFSIAYFTLSVYALNKISTRFFPYEHLNFHWNIYNFIKK